MVKLAARLLNSTHSVVTRSPLGMVKSKRIDVGRSFRMRENSDSIKRNPWVSFASKVADRGLFLDT